MLEVKGKFHLGAWDVGTTRIKEGQLTRTANYEMVVSHLLAL